MNDVRVAIVWHLHQPNYLDPIDGHYVLPWVRLHALKDYLGMLALLEATPGVQATFNLVPCLVDQLEAYANGTAREPLLELGLRPVEQLDDADRRTLLRSLYRGHPRHLIGRFPRYAELHQLRGQVDDEDGLKAALGRLGAGDWRDLLVLSKLAWCDLDESEHDPRLTALINKGRDFTPADVLLLAAYEREALARVLPAYRRAADRGQIELLTSPYDHPILPLLCDSIAHHEAHPGAPLPLRYQHPEDAAEQIARALVRHAAVFGQPARGLWPPEGALSEAAVTEIARAGLRFTISDEAVLERSLQRALHRDSGGAAYPLEVLYRPWSRSTACGELGLLFRDRALSELIGFSYAGTPPDQAANDLLQRLRRVGEQWAARGLPEQPVVTLALDGENAWEHYPDGGRAFLRAFYRGLQDDPQLHAVTASAALAATPAEALPRVFAGSWISGDLSVWIGHADDREAWNLIGAARETLETSRGHVGPAQLERARAHLGSASGSDWCWWYGDEHQSEDDFEFDRLFRRHLQAMYRELGLTPPEALARPLITTRVAPVKQSRPLGRVSPTLDGELSSPDEWLGAGVYRASIVASTRRDPLLHAVHFGYGDERVALLLETSGPGDAFLTTHRAEITFPGPTAVRYRVQRTLDGCRVLRDERKGAGLWMRLPTRARAAAGSVIEIVVPVSELRPAPGQLVEFRVAVLRADTELEVHPGGAALVFPLGEVSLG